MRTPRVMRAPAERLAARFGWPARNVALLRGYGHLLGGSLGRLGLSLIYFMALTRALSIAEFGFFASAVAVGTVLSRLTAFGYGAILFQVSARRPRTLGHYYVTYLLWLGASLPVIALLALFVDALLVGAGDRLPAYALVVAAEVGPWRVLDAVATLNNGFGRFARAAAAYNIAVLCRTAAALAFLGAGASDLTVWSGCYLAANLAALAIALVLLLPRRRLRWRRGMGLLRTRDALALSGAGLASVLQAEIDKILVLTFGGSLAAGVYAICIRLIDLTAVPIRAFNVLMIRRILTDPRMVASPRLKLLAEVGIALVSTGAYGGLVLMLWLRPGLLGSEVASALGVLGALWAVPAARNLVEYQAELLYAHGRMTTTLYVALGLTAVKAALIAVVFWQLDHDLSWGSAVNMIFVATYVISAIWTYRSLHLSASRPAGLGPAG